MLLLNALTKYSQKFNYSYLKASIGLSKEALYAGYYPKATPTRPENPSDNNTENNEIFTDILSAQHPTRREPAVCKL